MSVTQNLNDVLAQIPDTVRLVAVSKTHSPDLIAEAYSAGQRIFGENKVQELVDKYATLPKDIEWHFIGHLQRNKIKFLAPFVSLIHSGDSLRLLETLNKEAEKNNRRIDYLLQFHIAEEESKTGLSWNEAERMLLSEEWQKLKHVRACGVMGMSTFTDNEEVIKKEFSLLAQYFRKLKNTYFEEESSFSEISMGMSGDYQLAIESGSTMVRIGSSIFGYRNYGS